MSLSWIVKDSFFFQEKKKKKVAKAKPILVNKDDAQLVLEVSPSADANHFETIHPKDDLEMRRQSVSSPETLVSE